MQFIDFSPFPQQGCVMFIVKFLENIFANSLKDKPGPSFAYTYLLVWLVINYQLVIKIIATKGGLVDQAVAFEKEIQLALFLPSLWVTFVIIIVKPWLNNIGLVARESSDKATQHLLKYFKVKSYRTEEEFQAVVAEKELHVTTNIKLREEITQYSDEKQSVINDFKGTKIALDDSLIEKEAISTKLEAAEHELESITKTKLEYDKIIGELNDKNHSMEMELARSLKAFETIQKENSSFKVELSQVHEQIYAINQRLQIWQKNNLKSGLDISKLTDIDLSENAISKIVKSRILTISDNQFDEELGLITKLNLDEGNALDEFLNQGFNIGNDQRSINVLYNFLTSRQNTQENFQLIINKLLEVTPLRDTQSIKTKKVIIRHFLNRFNAEVKLARQSKNTTNLTKQLNLIQLLLSMPTINTFTKN